MKQKIAIFGGSFDPFHTDHLEIINECINSLNFNFVWIVPTHLSPFKIKVHCTDEQRIEMIKIGIKNVENVKINTFEIDQKESNTFKTISYFKSQYPDIDFTFIMGSDQVKDFHKWNNAKDLKKLIDFIVFEREEKVDLNIIKENKWELREFKNKHISSTKIRSLVQIEDQISELNEYSIKHLLFLDERLIVSKKRFDHSINVGLMAKQLASKFDIENEENAYIAGTLHDVAKELNDNELETLIKQINVELLKEPKQVWHSFAGSKLLESKWKIGNKKILNAVFSHTVGTTEMSTLDKIVFCADKISVERDYPGVENMRKLVMEDLELGFKELLKQQYEVAVKKHGTKNVGRLLEQTYKKYID